MHVHLYSKSRGRENGHPEFRFLQGVPGRADQSQTPASPRFQGLLLGIVGASAEVPPSEVTTGAETALFKRLFISE